MPDVEEFSIRTDGESGPKHVWQVTDELNQGLRIGRFVGVVEDPNDVRIKLLHVDASQPPDTKAVSIPYRNPAAPWQAKDAIDAALGAVEGSRLAERVEVSQLGAVALINYPAGRVPEYPGQRPNPFDEQL